MRIDVALEASDLVAQRKPALLEAAQQQFVQWRGLDEAINGGIKVRVVDSQLYELPG